MKSKIITTIAAITLAASTCLAQSGSINSISFQGALYGTSSQPLGTGNYDTTFRFWDGPASNANQIGTNIPVSSVPVSGGIMSTTIPVDPTWFNGQTRYLGVSLGNGVELTPRLLITAVPYSISASALGQNVFAGTGGYTGVGTQNPAALLQIVGRAEANPPFRLDQSGEGGDYGIMITSPGSGPSGRIYLENNNLVIGRGDGSKPIFVGSNGNVGLSTTTPRSSFDANGGVFSAGLGICASWVVPSRDDYWVVQPDVYKTGDFAINMHHVGDQANEGCSLYCYRNGTTLGYWGINTWTPQATLDVNGTARMIVCQITSDRNVKMGFQPVDARVVLEKLAKMPITTWSYTNSPAVRHLGPVAQDFAAAFQVGEDDKHIATVDADGVAFAAIQGLNKKQEEQNREMEVRIKALEDRLSTMERMLVSALQSAQK